MPVGHLGSEEMLQRDRKPQLGEQEKGPEPEGLDKIGQEIIKQIPFID